MKVRAQFFGILKDMSGVDSLGIRLQDGATLEDLKNKVMDKYPGGLRIFRGVVIAVNGEIARGNKALKDGDEVAFLPPVSGGAW